MIDAGGLRERCLAFPGSAETFPFPATGARLRSSSRAMGFDDPPYPY
jgi:hypothetical protein